MKKIKNNKDCGLVGGGSNTPLTDNYIEKKTLENRVLTDWLSVSFSHFRIFEQTRNNFILERHDPSFIELLEILGFNRDPVYLEMTNAMNGYSEGYVIGEGIKLFYGGHSTATKENDKEIFTLQLLMSGQACREFENYQNGSWLKLFKYILKNKGKVKRLDNAYDDFHGDIITPYQIEPFIRRHHFVSPLRKYRLIETGGTENGYDVLLGYSILIGSEGSNQLMIYDKLLERRAKGEIDFDVSTWYRYELRLVDDKALRFIELYVASVESNNSIEYMKLYCSVLRNYLDIKNPSPTQKTNKSLWNTNKKWLEFLNNVEKTSLNTQHKITTSIQKKINWKKSSVYGVDFNIRMALHGQGYKSMKIELENDLKAIDNLTNSKLQEINNYREQQGLNPYTMDYIKTYLKKDLQNQLLELKDLEKQN